MLVVKNMYHFDNFGVTGASTVLLPGYPPSIGLFEIFFNLFSSSFKEGNIYKGLNILTVSLLMPPLKKYGADFKGTALRFFVLLAVPMIFFPDAYGDTYVDCLLGIMFARLIYIGFSEERYDGFFLYNFSISSAVLVLAKAAGMGLYLFAMLALAIDIIFFSKKLAADGLNIKNRLIKLIAWTSILIIPFTANWSWKTYLKINALNSAWNTSSITVSGILELFTDKIPEYRVVTIETFTDSYFYMGRFGDIGFRCSYFLFPVIFTFAMIAASHMGGNGRRVKYLNFSLFISYILYTVSLLILYLFTYSQREAESIASFSRYMNTITLGYMLAAVIVLLNPADIHREKSAPEKNPLLVKKLNFAIVIMAFLLTSVELKDLFLLQARSAEKQRKRAGHIDGLYGLFDYETDRIYYISQGRTGYEYWQARYALTPVSVNPGDTWSIANDAKDEIWTIEKTAQEWSDELKADYTYVYIDIIDEQFCMDFGELFEDPDNIPERTIYKIEVTEQNDLVTLVPFWF
ncbi:MAG: hypothetical protein NC341_04365 [Blautia sp.]|nr:hypothetical protein [Blautia sp.]MCM1200870.1 hypothetical protein [Bacteroides fragilis]